MKSCKVIQKSTIRVFSPNFKTATLYGKLYFIKLEEKNTEEWWSLTEDPAKAHKALKELGQAEMPIRP